MKKEQSKQDAALIIDFFHRSIMHYALWFSEIRHQFDRVQAHELLEKVWEKSAALQLNRLSKIFDFEMEDGLPDFLVRLSEDKRNALKKAMAVNWLANDGIWFQAVEFSRGMNDAKRCNDSCWGQFSPLEAVSVKKLLGLGEHPGLDGLKEALKFRLYAFINKQSFTEETEKSFVFRMNECRVQLARKRKGLDDYPCKSGGLVEYTTFAQSIDSRIKTKVLACPPDPHPDDYFCAWKFYID